MLTVISLNRFQIVAINLLLTYLYASAELDVMFIIGKLLGEGVGRNRWQESSGCAHDCVPSFTAGAHCFPL